MRERSKRSKERLESLSKCEKLQQYVSIQLSTEVFYEGQEHMYFYNLVL